MLFANYIRILVKINGIFDIISGFGLMFNIPYIGEIHISRLKKYDKLHKRLLAYWVINYGIIRLMSNNLNILEISYFLEAMFFVNELKYKKFYNPYYRVSRCLMIAGFIDMIPRNKIYKILLKNLYE